MEINIRPKDIAWSEKISQSKFEMEGRFDVGGKSYKVTVCYEGAKSEGGAQNLLEEQIGKIRETVKNSLAGQAKELAKLAGYSLAKPLGGDRLVLFREGREVSNHALGETLEKVKPLFEKIFSQKLILHPGTAEPFEKSVTLGFAEYTPTNKEPESYRLDTVCKKVIFAVKGKSPRRAIEVIEKLSKSQDPRFNSEVEGTGRFQFDKGAVIAKLEQMAEKDATAIADPIDKKEMERVAMQLVPVVEREDVSYTFSTSETVVQKAGHSITDSDGRASLSEKKSSISAEIAKKERGVQALANTASLQIGEDVICFRSAKTHKKHLQEERSKSDILMRAEASCDRLNGLGNGQNLNGLKKNQDGTFSYQPVIFTMMDASFLKAVGTSLPGIAKRIASQKSSSPIENERKFLQKMVLANQLRFKDREFIEHSVKLKNGEEIKVREYPAIIQNHLFSSQSKRQSNRESVRNGNISGQIQMLGMMEQKHPGLLGENFSRLLEKKNLTKLSERIRQAYEKTEDPTEKIVLKAFHANLTGKSIDGNYSYNERDSGADLAMLTGIQADYLGLSFSIQCKSGNDRTIAAAGHKIAQELFKRTKGSYYDPEVGEDKELYKKFYTESLIRFGFSNVEASRGPVNDKGQSGLKIAHSASAFKYMNKEDVEKHGELI